LPFCCRNGNRQGVVLRFISRLLAQKRIQLQETATAKSGLRLGMAWPFSQTGNDKAVIFVHDV